MRPKFSNGLARLYQADARKVPLKDGTVHCVVTSPPYFQQRVYRTDDDRVVGLEQTIEQYLANLVEVFREVRRVLRDDGILWVNLGESYSGSGKGQNADGSHAAKHGEKQHTSKGTLTGGLPRNSDHALEGERYDELSAGNLLGVPWRVALALQADGWIIRDCIVWAKASAMPQSLAGWRWEQCRVKVGTSRKETQSYCEAYAGISAPGPDHHGSDVQGAMWADCPGCEKCEPHCGLVLHEGSWRCTTSHEYIFMLVKSMGYWSDGDAVKTFTRNGWHGSRFTDQNDVERDQALPRLRMSFRDRIETVGANRRSVWRDIKPENLGGKLKHYATFPSDLPRICIQASTSERGCCPRCGNQITHIIAKPKVGTWHDHEENLTQGSRQNGDGPAQEYEVGRTIGWKPTCGHTKALTDPRPCLVLDPFGGVMTTCVAAMRLGRASVGMDLSEEYLATAAKRLSAIPLPLPLVGLEA